MSGNGRSLSRTSYLVPWADAVALVGERALTHRGEAEKAPAIISRYKNQGVPVQEVGRELHAAWLDLKEHELLTQGSDGVVSSNRTEGGSVPHRVAIRQSQVFRVFRIKGEKSDAWKGLIALLDSLAPLEDVEREQAVRPRPGGRARGTAAQE